MPLLYIPIIYIIYLCRKIALALVFIVFYSTLNKILSYLIHTPRSFSSSASPSGVWRSGIGFIWYWCLALLRPMCSLLHLSVLKRSCHWFAHSCNAFMSSCRQEESVAFLMSLKILVSSANINMCEWTIYLASHSQIL